MGSKSNKTGRQVSVVGWHVWKDGGDNRWTREAVRKPETSGSGPGSTVRLAGSRLQRRSCLCPRTAVHPLIGDGSKLFWSKIFHQRQGATDWQVVSGQIATAVHYRWKKTQTTPLMFGIDSLEKVSQCIRFHFEAFLCRASFLWLLLKFQSVLLNKRSRPGHSLLCLRPKDKCHRIVVYLWGTPRQPLGSVSMSCYFGEIHLEAAWAESCSKVGSKQNDNLAFNKQHCIY